MDTDFHRWISWTAEDADFFNHGFTRIITDFLTAEDADFLNHEWTRMDANFRDYYSEAGLINTIKKIRVHSCPLVVLVPIFD